MFDSPLWLALLIVPFVLLFYFNRRYYLRHSNVSTLKEKQRINVAGMVSKYCFWLGWVCLVLAAGNFTLGFVKKHKTALTHNYVLINDGSGSMLGQRDSNDPLDFGESIESLISANNKFLSLVKENEKIKNYVGSIVFSNDPFVVSPLVEDPDFVFSKLRSINWRSPPLGSGTEMNKAIWSGIMMVLKKNKDQGGSFYSEEDLFKLEARLNGRTKSLNLNDRELLSKTKKLKNELKGSCLIVFTDGYVTLDGDPHRKSTLKVLLLCKELDIKTYLISVQVVNNELRSYIEKTDGQAIVIKSINRDKLEKVYVEILSRESKESLVVDQVVKKSYSNILGFVSMVFLLCSTILNNTINRDITDLK